MESCLLLLVMLGIAAVAARVGKAATVRLARALARRPEGQDEVRTHRFGQCYGWRLGPDSFELRAWAGPGVWVWTWLGVLATLGPLALLMGAPAAAELAPKDPWLRDMARWAVALRPNPLAGSGSRWRSRGRSGPGGWRSRRRTWSWRRAARCATSAAARSPTRPGSPPPERVRRLGRDDNWVLLVVAPAEGETPGREERRTVFVAGRGDAARLRHDVAHLDAALRARIAAR